MKNKKNIIIIFLIVVILIFTSVIIFFVYNFKNKENIDLTLSDGIYKCITESDVNVKLNNIDEEDILYHLVDTYLITISNNLITNFEKSYYMYYQDKVFYEIFKNSYLDSSDIRHDYYDDDLLIVEPYIYSEYNGLNAYQKIEEIKSDGYTCTIIETNNPS